MYNFVDTNGYAEGTSLPSEALKINGAYLEHTVTGYRTLYVKGREMLAPDIKTYETGVRDGSTLQSKRFPARTITVGYQLIATSAAAFRAAFNALNAALDVEEAELIFADEPDKFFIGTPSGRGDVPAGRNAITGEFDILCVDPFKYSVQEYEVTPTLDDGTTFAIQYNGTYRSYPPLVAEFADEDDDTAGGLTGNGDCGYVAFLSDDAAIIQLGDPDEPDTEDYAKSQTLTKQIFTSYNATVAAKWPINTGPPLLPSRLRAQWWWARTRRTSGCWWPTAMAPAPSGMGRPSPAPSRRTLPATWGRRISACPISSGCAWGKGRRTPSSGDCSSACW